VKAEVTAIERRFAAEVRASYARAISAARQLDALESLVLANEEIMRITNERLKEGDVAPLDLNLLRVETDKLKVQIVRARAELESEMIELRALVGMDQAELLRVAPLPQKPPRLDMSLVQLTEIALRERADLQASKLGEELGAARIKLAQAQSKPNIEGSVRYSRTKGILDLPEKLGPNLVATDSDNELTFGIKIELPFFNRNQGEVASAAAEKLLAQRERESLEAAIKRDVALAFRRYRAAAESLVIYAAQIVPRSEENLRSVRAAYQLGEFSTFDVVNEQRKLIESETGYNEALRDYYAALAELESAIGTKLPSEGFSTTSILPGEDVFKRSDFLRAVTTQTVKREN
jgi:cobalt-zinc-cadmium efflux system outer membrane protein